MMTPGRHARLFLVASLWAAMGLAACSSSPSSGNGPGSGGNGSGGATAGSGGAGLATGTGGTTPTGTGGAGPTTGTGGTAPTGTGGSGTGSGGAAVDGGGAETAGPGPGGACAGTRVCEDFESYAVGSAPGGIWTPQISNGTLVVDEMRASSGKRALHLKGGTVADTTLYIVTKMPALPVPSNALYGRAMIYFPKVPNGSGLHWDLIRGSGKRPGGVSSQYNIGTARGGFLIDSEPNDCTRYSKTLVPEGRWACLSWLFDGSAAAAGAGTKNEIHLSLDGKPIDDATVVKFGDACTYNGKPEWVAPVFDSFSIGWEQYHPGPEFEMWVDDVAIGDAPIPCPP